MATLDDIVARGVLRRYEADLRAGEQVERVLYVTPSLEAWCDTYLWAAPKDRGRNLTPYEQTDSMFTHFVAGRPMAYGKELRKLEPIGFGVWEMRPTDVRIFGYFYIKRVFIAVCGELKKNLTSNPMYEPFINQVKHVIDTTDLDQPKVLSKTRLRDVL